jgi:hypothetical protein
MRDDGAPISGVGPDRTWGYNPLTNCRRVTIAFLQGLFAQKDRGNFKWSVDDKVSEIFIYDANPIDPKAVGNRPAINVLRSPVQFGKLFMDDAQDFDDLTGERTHSDMLSGTLIINCLSKQALEAEEVGWITTRHLWILRRMLLRRGFHDFGRGMRVDSVTPAGALVSGDSDSAWRKVSILAPFHFRYCDTLTPENLSLIGGIEMFIDAQAGLFLPETRSTKGLVGTSIGQETDSGFEVNREGEEPPEPETLSITVEA